MENQILAWPLGQARAAVKVERVNLRENQYRIVPGSICLVAASTLMFEQPERQILDEDGEEIVPTGRFLWSAETLAPYHLVVDMF